MIPAIEPVLFRDEQAVAPVGFCPRCCGAVYAWGGPCARCGEVQP